MELFIDLSHLEMLLLISNGNCFEMGKLISLISLRKW